MIHVTQPYLPAQEKYEKYLKRIYQSRWLTNNGQLVQELEKKLCDYLGIKNLLLVCNGTIALNLAYKLLEVKKPVITTPFSFVATTSSLEWDNIGIDFCDINSESFNIDPVELAQRTTHLHGAILPVHVFGNPCDVESIQKIAKEKNVRVIYDAAHCFGVRYKNKSLLQYGDISTVSFHATKLFHTVEGGGVIINDDDLFERSKEMINFGLSDGKINSIGLNAKMSEFHAAMGLAVLEDIEDILYRRKEIVSFYRQELSSQFKLQKIHPDCVENNSYFPIVFESEKHLEEALKCFHQNQIFPRRYFHPSLETLPYIAKNFDMPVSRNISERILCLPLYADLKDEEVKKIINLLKL